MRLSVDDAERGILAGHRGVFARAITLVESARPEDREKAEELLARLAPRAGGAVRLGISGPPGVGKSTFIEALGMLLVERGHRVAVLAVDPSSSRTGGSILGDKTRMAKLSMDTRAFVRPSPAGDHLGGVAERTRETMLLCEAFGFDVVLVETVGVGQSETEVASLVDCFLLLALAAAGDELQGIKRGIMELVDIAAVNKADGDLVPRARAAARDLSAALRLQRPRFSAWTPRAVLVSGLTGAGVSECWDLVLEHRQATLASGELEAHRRASVKAAFRIELGRALLSQFMARPGATERLTDLEARVARGELTPERAAREIVQNAGLFHPPTTG